MHKPSKFKSELFFDEEKQTYIFMHNGEEVDVGSNKEKAEIEAAWLMHEEE